MLSYPPLPTSTRRALDPLDQVVDGFGRPVGHEGSVPGDDVVPPAGDGATERADLDGAGIVLEVDTKLGDELVGQLWVGDLVDGAHDFLGVPGGAHLTTGIAG